MKAAEARAEFGNHVAPGYAECVRCHGNGWVWKNMSELFEGPQVIKGNCPDCAGTKRQPIPITEVISGLRRGSETPKKVGWLYTGCE